MAKTRKQAIIKKDFQKIKLKLGRKLKKDLNVTDTSFKAKKIVVREQLKRGLEEIACSTKPGIKELLSRLQHYNPSTRFEVLIKLKDLLSSNPNHIITYLSTILERLCEQMVDKDSCVRKTVTYVLSMVLSRLTENQISPFFPVMSSYICCAMTHIISDIQKDSLKYLDLMLEKFPDLTVSSGSQILPNFLNQISTLKNDSNVRTLLVTPNERITSQNWRINVLKRMERFLEAAFRHWDFNAKKAQKNESKEILWDCQTPFYMTIYNNRECKPQTSLHFSLASITNKNQLTEMNDLKDAKSVEEFISVLLPLLVETWVECVSSRSKNNANLSSEEAETMNCILKVSSLLGNWTEKLADGRNSDSVNLRWFQSKFAQDFVVHFMPGFPYTVSNRNAKKENSRSSELSSADLNISICEVYTLLNINKYYSKIIKFMENTLRDGSMEGKVNIEKTIKVLQRLINLKIVDNQDSIEPYIYLLLDSLWERCQTWNHGRKDRQLIVSFFVKLVLNTKYREIAQCGAITSWLRSLSKEIIQVSDYEEQFMPLMKDVRKISGRGYKPFLLGLQENDIAIISLLKKFGSTEDGDDHCMLQRYIIEIISAIPKLSLTIFQNLAMILRMNSIAVRNVNYLLQILSIRCFNQDDPGFQASFFLSLLLSLQFGLSQNDTAELREKYNATPEFTHFIENTPAISQFVVFPTETATWERYMYITEEVSRILLLFPEMHLVEKATYHYLESLLEQSTHIPAHSAAGILNLITTLHMRLNNNGENLNSDLQCSIAELALGSLGAGVLLTSMPLEITINYRCDELMTTILSCLKMTEMSSLVFELLGQQINELKTLSEGQAKCVLAIILYFLKSDYLPSAHIKELNAILGRIKLFSGLNVHALPLWNEVCYQLKEQRNHHHN